MLHDKQLFKKAPFQSTKYRKKELYVDNIKTIGDVYCPTCRNEECVYVSTIETTSFYDCKKCQNCCHVLNIPFKDQKPTIMLFGGDGTHCFAKKSSRDYEKEKPSSFLKKFLRQSQSSTSEREAKKDKSSPTRKWHSESADPAKALDLSLAKQTNKQTDEQTDKQKILST